jgi:dienelactone hydrolase
MKTLLFSALTVCLSFTLMPRSASGEIVEGPLEYKSGEVVCEGWQAYAAPLDKKRSGVLIVPQWTGVSDNEKMRAKMLADMGYNVFVADIYGKGIRPQPPEAG